MISWGDFSRQEITTHDIPRQGSKTRLNQLLLIARMAIDKRRLVIVLGHVDITLVVVVVGVAAAFPFGRHKGRTVNAVGVHDGWLCHIGAVETNFENDM